MVAIVTHRICRACGRSFPEDLVQPLVVSPNTFIRFCPICALAFLRRIHKNPHYFFKSARNKQRYRLAKKLIET